MTPQLHSRGNRFGERAYRFSSMHSQMHFYSIFGGHLGSTIRLPELQPVGECTPDWTVRECDAFSHPGGTVIGTMDEMPCAISLARTSHGYHLRHACTAEYEIEASEIRVRGLKDPSPQRVQNDLTGRVIPVVLHTAGMLCLHASAVVLGSSAVAFVAESGYGKSTLALALAGAGNPLLTDDALVVDFAPDVVVRPGVPHVRVNPDSSSQLAARRTPQRSDLDGKHIFDFGAPALAAPRSALGAVYVLAPCPADDGAVVHREQLAPSRAAMALIRHAKIGMLLGGVDALVVLERATQVARQVPVYTLHVPRDLGAIDRVVSQLEEWHAYGALAAVD